MAEELPFRRRDQENETQPLSEVIGTFPYRHDAEYAQGFLDDAEIASLLLSDDAGGLYPGMAFSRPARLAVRPDDAEAAKEVLRDAGVI